jgi:hypothetical protein
MHASRKWVQLTTAMLWVLAAGCGGGSSTAGGSDAGCVGTTACSGDTDCPTITCHCTVVGLIDAGGATTVTKMIPGACTGGCCAPCPADCTPT